MGAFLALRRDRNADSTSATASRIAKCFSAQGFRDRHIIESASWQVLVYRKLNCDHQNFLVEDSDNFIFVTGTFIYREAIGAKALESFFRDFRSGSINWNLLYGHYCIGVCVDRDLQIFVDRAGIYKVYLDSEERVFSSSFLAVLESLRSPHVNEQAIYEYVFQGATYGNDTVVSEISLLGPERRAGPSAADDGGNPGPILRPGFIEADRHSHVERNLSNLRSYFRAVANVFGANIDCALSGGYDTRLLLALLEERGVRPKLHVYGDAGDNDVRVAKLIASGEGVELSHVDKSTYPVVAPDEYPAVVERNFLAFDGWPSDGIFNNGSDLQTRLDRCANAELMLNGGGGEVFRNFFYLPDRPFSVKQLLWTFYSRFDPKVCTSGFSEEDYLSALARKIRAVLGRDRDHLERSDIEFLYPGFRCRFWMGRNTSVNNRFGWALTPFSDPNIIEDAIRVPLRYKSHGRFEAQLIRILNPRLAGYTSVYGHDFAEDPPISRRIKDMATLLRPPSIRRYTYRMKMRSRRGGPVPYYLSEQYIGKTIDQDFPYMSRFFRVHELRDTDQYNRLCTLEYLFQRYSASIN